MAARGEVKHAADIKVGVAGRRGAFTAFVLDADIPAVLREGALEALGGQLDFERDALSFRTHGMNDPLNANEMGHYVLRVVEFDKGPPRWGRGPCLAASYFEWSFSGKRPRVSEGGLHLPLKESGRLRYVPPKEFSACTAVTLGDARGDSIPDPKKFFLRNYVLIGDVPQQAKLSARWRIRGEAIPTWWTLWTTSWSGAMFAGPLIKRRMFRMRAIRWAQCSMQKRRLTFCFWMISLPRMRWICSPKLPSFLPSRPKTRKMYGMPSAGGGWAPLGRPSVPRRMRAASGRMKFGRIGAQAVEFKYSSKELVLIRGYWGVEMGPLVEF